MDVKSYKKRLSLFPFAWRVASILCFHASFHAANRSNATRLFFPSISSFLSFLPSLSLSLPPLLPSSHSLLSLALPPSLLSLSLSFALFFCTLWLYASLIIHTWLVVRFHSSISTCNTTYSSPLFFTHELVPSRVSLCATRPRIDNCSAVFRGFHIAWKRTNARIIPHWTQSSQLEF